MDSDYEQLETVGDRLIPVNDDKDNLKSETNSKLWTRQERWMWSLALFLLSVFNYCCRNAAPLSAISMEQELDWNKEQTGLVLSSFFWGYTATQIPAGYCSDLYGGSQVITMAAIGWGTITMSLPGFIYLFPNKSSQLLMVVVHRIVFGALQALHYPASISLLSTRVDPLNKSKVYSMVSSGSSTGVLVSGLIGSYLLSKYNWHIVFYFFGFCSVTLAVFIRKTLMKKHAAVQIEIVKKGKEKKRKAVPWRLWFKSKAFWAMLLAAFSNGYAYFLLFSWLPSYFEDRFPGEKGWVYNVVPWTASIPAKISVGFLADKLILKYSVTTIRKLMQAVCGAGTVTCLILITYCHSYFLALFLVSCFLFFDGFNSAGLSINPQDLAPSWAGFVYGFSNSASAIPGFFAVYISGYLLHSTGSWVAVFLSTAMVAAAGSIIFLIFGSGEKII